MQRQSAPRPTRPHPRPRSRAAAVPDTDGTLALLAFLALVLDEPSPR
ncbi:MAG: hypothetical protein ACJ79W_01305 [Myxococcales bacterium]